MSHLQKSRPDLARTAYDQFAAHYDAFTGHYDSSAWIAGLLAAAEPLGLSGNRLLDVACGTGNSFLPLLDRGWKVTGCDLSEAMLAQARQKTSAEVTLFQADMRALKRVGEFDLVTCLGDALNYLADIDQLAACLRGLSSNLAAGGLVIFDVNTVRTYRSFFAETDVRAAGQHRLCWRGLAGIEFEPGDRAEATFEVESEDGEASVPATLHRQRHFPRNTILRALGRTDLKALGIFGHGLDGVLMRPLDERRHTKAIYICAAVKPGGRR